MQRPWSCVRRARTQGETEQTALLGQNVVVVVCVSVCLCVCRLYRFCEGLSGMCRVFLRLLGARTLGINGSCFLEEDTKQILLIFCPSNPVTLSYHPSIQLACLPLSLSLSLPVFHSRSDLSFHLTSRSCLLDNMFLSSFWSLGTFVLHPRFF